jgi:hypothetical protein
VRKLKAGAVEVNGAKVPDQFFTPGPGELLIKVGKNWRRVRVPGQ